MKLLKKAYYAVVFTGIIATTLQCASSKDIVTSIEKPKSFKVKPVYFQEWYAGIKVGGTGINIFIPVVNEADNVEIDSVYFRNLKGKLTKRDGRYSAILKNKSPHYIFVKSERGIDYPFSLKDNECAIRYTENGETKYLKITKTKEKEGTYYENGPPTKYLYNSSSILVTADNYNGK